MRVALKIFWRDLRRILANPVAVVIALGVAAVPSLYAWLNILSNWDPYVNTSDVAVAVVNLDEGTELESSGYVNAGDMIVEALAENTQIGWTFVDEDEALEGVYAGRYYAAIEIPADFTEQLASVIDGDTDKAHFTYYVNEKANAIAPKVTDTGATTIEREIDNQFIGTVYGIVIERVQEFAGGSLGLAADTTDDAMADVLAAKESVDGIAEALDGADGLIAEAEGTVGSARDAVSSLTGTGASIQDALLDATNGLSSARSQTQQLASDLNAAVTSSSGTLSSLVARTGFDVGSVTGDVGWATGKVDSAITELEETLSDTETVLADLRATRDLVVSVTPKNDADAATQTEIVSSLDVQIGNLVTLTDSQRARLEQLRALNQQVKDAADATQAVSDTVGAAATEGVDALTSTTATVTGTTIPQLESALDTFSGVSRELSAAAGQLDPVLEQMDSILSQLDATFETTSEALAGTRETLADSSEALGELAEGLSAIQASSAWQSAEQILSLDSEAIKDYMDAPVDLESVAVYPVENYGSGIAPFFSNVAMWVGGIAIIAIFKLEVDKEGIGDFKPWQGYLGRWMLCVLIGLLNAVITITGDLLIGIQCVDVPALYLAAMVASFAFVNIIYALAVAFKHIGKALAFFLIIMQVPGSSGTYPIEMMPGFFQAICPWLPFTYSNNAMREAIAGYYGNYYWHNLLMLLLFVVPALLVGIGARRHLLNINSLFDRKLAETDLWVHEEASLENPQFRLSTIIKVIANNDEYRDTFRERIASFERAYPTLIRRGLVALVAVPVLLFAVLVATGGTYAAMVWWVVSIIVIDTYLIVVEYLHDRVAQKTSLAAMSRGDLYRVLADNLREQVLQVAPMETILSRSPGGIGSSLRERIAARRGGGPGEEPAAAGTQTADERPPEAAPTVAEAGPAEAGRPEEAPKRHKKHHKKKGKKHPHDDEKAPKKRSEKGGKKHKKAKKKASKRHEKGGERS